MSEIDNYLSIEQNARAEAIEIAARAVNGGTVFSQNGTQPGLIDDILVLADFILTGPPIGPIDVVIEDVPEVDDAGLGEVDLPDTAPYRDIPTQTSDPFEDFPLD